MSGVDVLAVLDEAIPGWEGGCDHDRLGDMREARAAVAELIDAMEAARPFISRAAFPGALARVDAALAGVRPPSTDPDDPMPTDGLGYGPGNPCPVPRAPDAPQPMTKAQEAEEANRRG